MRWSAQAMISQADSVFFGMLLFASASVGNEALVFLTRSLKGHEA